MEVILIVFKEIKRPALYIKKDFLLSRTL